MSLVEAAGRYFWNETVLNARSLSPPRRDVAGILDVHIPKAGGTSLAQLWEPLLSSRKLCGKNIYQRYTIVLSPITSNDECDGVDSTLLLTGHASLNVSAAVNVMAVPRVLTVTMLREPLARMVSYANFDNIQIEEFESSKFTELSYTWHRYGSNYMTAMINGVPDLKNVIIGYKTIPVRGMCSYDAKDAISTARFRLVNEVTVFGITEFYAESMWLFGRTFNWPRHLMLAPINVRTEHFCLSSVRRRDCGKFHFHVSDLKPETVEAVREEEVCDRALYQTAKAVFKARIQAAPPDAQSDLRDFVSNFS